MISKDKKLRTTVTQITLSITIALYGCSSAPRDDTPPPAVENTQAALPKDSPSIPSVKPVPSLLPPIVARVNGSTTVTREELERAVRANETKAGQVVPPQFRDQVYRRVLDQLIDFHLLLEESTRRQVVAASDEVESEIARVRNSYPTAQAFDEQLREWGTSLEALREETRKDLLVAKTIEMELEPALNLKDETVQAFYDQHSGQFTTGESIHASHILIGTSPTASPTERAQSLETARELREQVIARTTDFAELAREYSTDEETASNGGDLGAIERGQTVEPFDTALFALKTGEISPVVESPFGFHIIKAGQRQEGEITPFQQVRDQIRSMLLQQERQLLMSTFLADLRKAGNVVILI